MINETNKGVPEDVEGFKMSESIEQKDVKNSEEQLLHTMEDAREKMIEAGLEQDAIIVDKTMDRLKNFLASKEEKPGNVVVSAARGKKEEGGAWVSTKTGRLVLGEEDFDKHMLDNPESFDKWSEEHEVVNNRFTKEGHKIFFQSLGVLKEDEDSVYSSAVQERRDKGQDSEYINKIDNVVTRDTSLSTFKTNIKGLDIECLNGAVKGKPDAKYPEHYPQSIEIINFKMSDEFFEKK